VSHRPYTTDRPSTGRLKAATLYSDDRVTLVVIGLVEFEFPEGNSRGGIIDARGRAGCSDSDPGGW
jgi:hypothetical protein